MHSNKDRIYRIHKARKDYKELTDKTDIRMSAYMQAGLASTLKSELPEVTASTCFNAGSNAIFNVKNKTFNEGIAYVYQDFLVKKVP